MDPFLVDAELGLRRYQGRINALKLRSGRPLDFPEIPGQQLAFTEPVKEWIGGMLLKS